MSKKLLLASLISMLLAGCNDESINISNPNIDSGSGEPPTNIIPPTDVIPPTTYSGRLMVSNKMVTGDVSCNDQPLINGQFKVKQDVPFVCTFGSTVLASFDAPSPNIKTETKNETILTSFNLKESKDNSVEANTRAEDILLSINRCEKTEDICLNLLDSYDIANVFLDLENAEAVNAFLKPKEEEVTDEVGKAPSSHVDTGIKPEVTAGTSNDLNNSFVSANAENSYAYKPSQEAKVLTTSTLTDTNNIPLAGIAFFSMNASGITDAEGKFEYLWGDKLTFGIDTFEFGSLDGNQVNYRLTDVTSNAIEKANIQSLLIRYATQSGGSLLIGDNVQQVFSQYPNVINELINLTLPNGGKIEGTEFILPNEFDTQFSQGLTQLIDNELRQTSNYSLSSLNIPNTFSTNGNGYVTESLQKIFKDVTQFHVFNDNNSFYGASGYTRGMRALNLSNRAFPVMMARADINKDIPFGLPQAWTREGRPYIATHPTINMPAIPEVSKENATFGFPFVTAGEIGKGKVVFMGNSLYPSIISCPDNYWANDSLRIDGAAKTCTTTSDLTNDSRNDNGSMATFFTNLFMWFNNGQAINGIDIATNIDTAAAARSTWENGTQYPFFVNTKFGFNSVMKLSKGGFDGLSAQATPILLLQAYPVKIVGDGQTSRFVSDTENSHLTQSDITSLINYVNEGGNILFMDAIDEAINPEPIGRLADTAGVSLGGSNVTPTSQAFCGSSYYCGTMAPNLHVKTQYEMVVLERFQDVDGKAPFTVNQDGSVTWIKDETKIKFEIPKYEIVKYDSEGNPELDANGKPLMISKYARIFVKNEAEKTAAINELKTAFSGTLECSDPYEYEFNCIETRKGDGIVVRGNYWRADFDRYNMSPDVVTSMVKAANLGSNFTALMAHELYYRTKGKQGTRLSTVELNQAYDNLSIWMWNDNDYAFDPKVQDELGFETAVGLLNCYTNDQHQMGTTCPENIKATLIANNMIYGADSELAGQMNPSYPLNYMEKPLTRIMLGRSFWDHEIKVDITDYPGRSTGSGSSSNIDINTTGKGVAFSAGNSQSTGLWAPQLSDITVSDGVKASITIMMADDLTGKPKHETSLKRPPRMQMSFSYDGRTPLTFKVPYGGLIYIKPLDILSGTTTATFNLTGVEKAAWWKNNAWVNTINEATAPIAEIDTGSFIYTTAIKNLESTDLTKFSADMNRFAEAASDFYGRDEIIEEGAHRRFTYSELKEFRHRFVNDVQISIGAAHSGYPVMNSSFNANSTTIPTNAIDDWLLWHEVGHNLAAAPFNVSGSTEVTNNLLALYMQELAGRNADPKMDRISTDIQKAPIWLTQNSEHAWSHGDAGMRLVMFGQLKVWAETHFNIDDWYSNADKKPSIYNDDQGWNLIKLMHRKARGDTQGDNGINYCSSKDTNLNGADLLMVCSSYISGYDLSEFFREWNVGESSSTNTDGSKTYSGGISGSVEVLSGLTLPKPKINPLSINKLN